MKEEIEGNVRSGKKGKEVRRNKRRKRFRERCVSE